MIYLDNAATTLRKPPQVEQAVLDAMRTAGNPGRGAHGPTLHASRLVYAARCAMAKLLHAPDPSCIAFAANATEALNIALGGLFAPGDHIITTVCEHNSVLRPLYRLREQGLQFSFAGVDERGRLQYDDWDKLVQPNTKALVVTGASNVTGNGTDLAKAAGFAHRHSLLLIVDAAQTAGSQPIDVQALGIDVLCFTGHKALLGPQGTGGLYVRPGLSIQPLVVGGSGVHSFDEQHPAQMPTALEAGTLNVPGLAGLCAGVEWILAQGVETLCAKETALAALFYKNIRDLPNVKIYGDPEMALHAPIISLNIGDEDSARIADILWEDYSICVRAGAHCAPLMHKALGTVEQGMVRFSFSHFNTEAEVLQTGYRPEGDGWRCGGGERPLGSRSASDRSRCSGACTGDLICASKKLILFFHSAQRWMPWNGKSSALRRRFRAGSSHCRARSPQAAALPGGCCRKNLSSGRTGWTRHVTIRLQQ